MFRVSITSRAERDLKHLDRQVKNRIVSAITTLASDPRPHGCLKVRSEEGVWRIRVEDWRYFSNPRVLNQLASRVGHTDNAGFSCARPTPCGPRSKMCSSAATWFLRNAS
jgi:mRNA interferase RelE/StbE